jgi:hypothetical protein
MVHRPSCPGRGGGGGGYFPGGEIDRDMKLKNNSDQVTNAWSYTSTSQYVLMEWCLIKHGNFILLLLLLSSSVYFMLTVIRPVIKILTVFIRIVYFTFIIS